MIQCGHKIFEVEARTCHFKGFRVRVFSNCKDMGFNLQPYGIQSMLKEGHKHLSGLDEAVLKNIDACKQLSTITRTSLGPNGNNHAYPFSFSLFSIHPKWVLHLQIPKVWIFIMWVRVRFHLMLI